jgi:hypothetical protein
MPAVPQLYKWDDIVLEHVRDGISRKFIAGDREMVAQIFLKRGAIVPSHSHESEQLTYVLTGALTFTLDGRNITAAQASCCEFRRGCRTALRRSRTRSSWICSAQSVRTGSTERTITSGTRWPCGS